MRGARALLFALQICLLASVARAETLVKAEDCSSAVSGTMIGSHVEIHCLSKDDIARVVDALVRQGLAQRAEDVGLEQAFFVSFAARLKPTEKLDLLRRWSSFRCRCCDQVVRWVERVRATSWL